MRRIAILTLAVLSLLGLSCNEVSRDSAPVELVATVSQDIGVLDLAGGEGCNDTLGTITLRAIQKNPDLNPTFLAIDLERMRVSYSRTDGGSLTPSAFTQTIDGFIEPGGSSTLNNFIVFEQGAFNQAPFAALLPINGGTDPETGRQSVKMDVVIEIYGETLSGEDVAAVTRFPLEFCYNCGGCR